MHQFSDGESTPPSTNVPADAKRNNAPQIDEAASPVTHRTASNSRMRTLFVGLLVAIVLIAFPFSDSGSTDFAPITVIGCSMALAAITAIQFSVGRRSALRFVICIIALLINGIVLTIATSKEQAAVTLLPSLVAVPVSLVLESIKFQFGDFSQIQSPKQIFHEGLQFKISHLLVATTFVAALCALVRAIQPWITAIEHDLAFVLASIAAIIACNTLTTVWALMGHQISWRLPVTLAVLTSTYFLGLFLMPHFFPQPRCMGWDPAHSLAGVRNIPVLAASRGLSLHSQRRETLTKATRRHQDDLEAERLLTKHFATPNPVPAALNMSSNTTSAKLKQRYYRQNGHA